jgi:hypothetical protein
MVENRIGQTATPLAPTPAPERTSTVPAASGVEFRALLDRLREQAAALERTSDRPLGAEELSVAVRDAGDSLASALSLAEGLLESYHASRMSR